MLDASTKICGREIGAHTRLALSVKKDLVLASVPSYSMETPPEDILAWYVSDEGQYSDVEYLCLRWEQHASSMVSDAELSRRRLKNAKSQLHKEKKKLEEMQAKKSKKAK